MNTLQSAIYEGHVRHRRFHPISHTLSYSLFMMYLDLSEIETVCQMHPFWSQERWNLASFYRKDYFQGKEQASISITDSIRRFLKEKTGAEFQGSIRLLTHFRYMGICFNPVSFYFCFNPNDTHVDYIIADVNNTPWNERYLYLMCNQPNATPNTIKPVKGSQSSETMILNQNTESTTTYIYTLNKQFHVSPFNPMNMQYRWAIKAPGNTISIHMESFVKDKKHFDATLKLLHQPLTRQSLGKMIKRYPAVSLKVLLGIYSHAIKLWIKKAPFYSHPNTQSRT